MLPVTLGRLGEGAPKDGSVGIVSVGRFVPRDGLGAGFLVGTFGLVGGWDSKEGIFGSLGIVNVGLF